MKYLALFVAFVTGARGFGVAPLVTTTTRPTTALRAESSKEEGEPVVAYFEDWVEAVECASHFGRCSLGKLEELAEKVEAGLDSGCTFESDLDEEMCDKERADRQRVADLLRLQANLKQGMEDLEHANIFARDVRDEHDIRERDLEIELLCEDGI